VQILVKSDERPRFWRQPAASAVAILLGGASLGLAIPLLSDGYVALLLGVLAFLLFLILWAMPAPRSVPLNAAWFFLVCVIAVTAIWPSYIALRLPGLPWLNLPRLLISVFLGLWLYCLLNSSDLRRKLADDYERDKPLFNFLGLWIIMMFLSIAVSRDVSESLTKVINFQLSNTAALFAVVSLATTPKRLNLLAIVIFFCGLFELTIGLLEARYERPLWIDFNPPGFSSDEEFVAGLLEGVWREGEYRVQGHFFVSLSYAEFLALTLPFAYHFGLTAGRWWLKAASFGYVLLAFPAIYVSGSRLGMVGFFLVGLVYAGFFAVRCWRESRTNIFGPILLMLYPLLLLAFVGAVSVSNRLQDAMIGDGRTEASDEGRAAQREVAYPRILRSPIIGYGMAQGAAEVAYTNAAGQGSFDNYILLVPLDNGIPGLIGFLGIVLWTIIASARLYFTGRTPISKLAAAISVFFIAFIVIRWVLAQQENHQLVMVVAGMCVCIRRIEAKSTQDAAEAGQALALAQQPPILKSIK
jgi:O-antigen ligase